MDSRYTRTAATGMALSGGALTMGTALAMTMSWTANKSILWAILHGLCSWLYVIFRAVQG